MSSIPNCKVDILPTLPPDVAAARGRAARIASLRPFFRPRSVAVFGASRNPAGIGRRLFKSLLDGDFQGPVYPVNPKANEVAGVRAYPSASALPEVVDLAVVAVPRDAVLGVVDDCAQRGVPALLVITAGFAEVGGEGRELQRQLVEKVRGHGMRLIGPNCLGVLSTDPAVRLNATFVPLSPPPGRMAMSSESGALGLAILAEAARLGLGISSCVSVGNRADVSSNDLLEYWEEDDATDVILLYLESFGNPRRFARIARRVGRRKPIVAVKAGRTRAGRRTAGSHTAALAAGDVAVDALFHQTGILRAETLEEMFDLAAVLGGQPLPAGRRVGLVTNAGGPAVLCADACEAGGLVVPEFSEPLRTRLADFLPAAASLGNPVDMIASATPEQFRRAITTILGTGEVDALVVVYVSAGASASECFTQAIRESVEAARKTVAAGQPVLACLMPEQGIRSLVVSGRERIPCCTFPEAAARVLSKVAAYAEWRARPAGRVPALHDVDVALARKLCGQALAERGPGWLTTEETRRVLQVAGLPVLPGGIARTAEEAAALARTLGFPVAVKLASHSIVHKTEIGGVRLNLVEEALVRSAFVEIRSRLERDGKLDAMEGVLVQPMVVGGTEVMVGMTQDPLFGPLVAFGLGGVHVEILGDVCFRVTPLTDRDAGEMVRAIRGYPLLQGYRGHPAADVPALEEVLLRVSRLVEEIPEIRELDLNPIIALAPGAGCRIIDARVCVQLPPDEVSS
jgi:acetyl coenzyme A synthetase (ADP forming)-like protein